MTIIVFYVLALAAVAGAVGVILARAMVKAALSLLLTFLAVACLYLSLEAEMLAALQVLVYAGAVLVLFLFVIMLLAGGNEERGRLHLFQRLAGLALGVALVLIVGQALMPAWFWTEAADSAPMSQTPALAAVLFTRYLLPFEATSLLLLAAVVGAVVLAGRRPAPHGWPRPKTTKPKTTKPNTRPTT
ncbi:MAG: NADH-quinone oxidoreductase subunit J [Pseudomonadota bacterium]